jgi:hypothetical protein
MLQSQPAAKHAMSRDHDGLSQVTKAHQVQDFPCDDPGTTPASLLLTLVVVVYL